MDAHGSLGGANPAPTSPGPLRRLQLAFLRLLVRTVGRLSEGIRLCLDHGLTSGKTLNYVYRNEPTGRLFLGRLIDRRFLGHPGWVAVRERRRNLEALLHEAIAHVREAGERPVLLDIASGPASYILAVVEEDGGDDLQALCRDLDARWLEEGRAEAERRGLGNVRFEVGDALDADALAALDPRPNVVVASGFYDWVTDDAVVERSVRLLAEVLAPGGAFVVTNQVAHPDLETTLALFTDFRNEPLAMRMRPQGLVHGWLEGAGLTIAGTRLDEDGYYSVSLATKAREEA